MGDDVKRDGDGELLERRVKTALGQLPADLLIVNGILMNVYTAEIHEGCSVAITGNRIVSVGQEAARCGGSDTKIIDACGGYITPGFIDPHTHLDALFQSAEYARYAVPHGNTTAVSETSSIANAAGIQGVRWFAEDSAGLPLRIFLLAPSVIPPFPEFETSKGISFDEFQTCISGERVLGVGETYWPRVVDLDDRIVGRYALAHRLGKTREGHAAGARRERLTAYCAAGTTSCHESTTAEEVVDKLRLGMGVMIREGSIRRELEGVAPIKDMGLDLRGVMLCTDLSDPEMLLECGGMDEVVRRAIEVGFDPMTAIQMATINSADYFGLRDLGGIAPGKIADLLVLSDLRDIHVMTVVKDGHVVAENGVLCDEPRRYRYPDAAYRTFEIGSVQPEDFFLHAHGDSHRCAARVLDVVNATITGEVHAELDVLDGNVRPVPEKNILKLAHIFKHSRTLQRAVGFVHGLGIRDGAVATSLLWDTNNILSAGATESDMAFAVNRVLELQGGFVVVRGERVVAELPMPICGVISDLCLEEIAQQMQGVRRGCGEMGCTVSNPFLTFQTLAFTGLPQLRLTDRGLADIRRRTFVDVILS